MLLSSMLASQYSILFSFTVISCSAVTIFASQSLSIYKLIQLNHTSIYFQILSSYIFYRRIFYQFQSLFGLPIFLNYTNYNITI